eukprot:TRINITY_DN12909_c0_g1_i1.p1 TRINITY_DN12909_c0_g1~~TRINITY_DN12909_c0_g1_i1.p1  ORF type:complete len:632 (-),score=97.84 TRINITY_DN12909_c0_g1_i1:356-2251(-)
MACMLLGYFTCAMLWLVVCNATTMAVSMWFLAAVVLSSLSVFALATVCCRCLRSVDSPDDCRCCFCFTFAAGVLVEFLVASVKMHTWFLFKILAGLGVGAAIVLDLLESPYRKATGALLDHKQLMLADCLLMVRLLKKDLDLTLADLGELGFGPDELATKYTFTEHTFTELIDIGFQPVLVFPLCGCSVTNLLDAGYTVLELYRLGIPEGLMTEAGCNLELVEKADSDSRKESLKALQNGTAWRFKKLGYSAKELYKAQLGFDAKDVLRAGYTTKEMYEAGFTGNFFKAAGCTLQEVREVCYKSDMQSLKQMKDDGFTIEDFRKGGYTAKQLYDMQLGFDARSFMPCYTTTELYESGCSEQFMKKAGCSLQELKEAGYPSTVQSLKKLQEAGFTAKDFKDDGYTPMGLYRMRLGFDVNNFLKAGYTVKDFKVDGCTAKELYDMQPGLDPKVFMTAYTTREMYESGCSAEVMKKAGCTLQQLRDADYPITVQSLRRLREAGFTAKDFKDDACTASALYMDFYFSGQDFKEAGYTAEDMYQAGASECFMKEGTYDLKELKKAGYGSSTQSLERLWCAGFTWREFVYAGFSPDQLRSAGIGLQDRDGNSENGTPVACCRCIPGLGCGRRRGNRA